MRHIDSSPPLLLKNKTKHNAGGLNKNVIRLQESATSIRYFGFLGVPTQKVTV